jgi:hypothetical protein
MKCLECDKRADCKDSREADGTRRRRYVCECGRAFTTIEVCEETTDTTYFASMNKNSAVYRWWAQVHQNGYKLGQEQARTSIRHALGMGEPTT